MDITTLNDAFIISAIVGAVLPALVALVTNRFASSQFKSLTLLGLTAVSSVLTPLVGSATVNWRTVLTTFAVQFGSAVLAYYGALKPLNIAGTDGLIQTKVEGGLGSGVTELKGFDEFDDDDPALFSNEGATDGVPTEGVPA